MFEVCILTLYWLEWHCVYGFVTPVWFEWTLYSVETCITNVLHNMTVFVFKLFLIHDES